MMSPHLSEEELQFFAIGRQVADSPAAMHIESCAHCQEQLAVYKLILSGIQEQPAPLFDFNLTDAVLQQLQPAPAPAKKTFSFRPVIIVAFIVIPLYLFRKNFLLLTTGISTAFLLLIVAACIMIIAFSIFKLYNKYLGQLDQLNISE